MKMHLLLYPRSWSMPLSLETREKSSIFFWEVIHQQIWGPKRHPKHLAYFNPQTCFPRCGCECLRLWREQFADPRMFERPFQHRACVDGFRRGSQPAGKAGLHRVASHMQVVQKWGHGISRQGEHLWIRATRKRGTGIIYPLAMTSKNIIHISQRY